jgi:cytochrome P450
VSYETLLATGGNETTAQLLSNLVVLLAERSDILDRLRREPALLLPAVEALIRSEPGVDQRLWPDIDS